MSHWPAEALACHRAKCARAIELRHLQRQSRPSSRPAQIEEPPGPRATQCPMNQPTDTSSPAPELQGRRDGGGSVFRSPRRGRSMPFGHDASHAEAPPKSRNEGEPGPYYVPLHSAGSCLEMDHFGGAHRARLSLHNRARPNSPPEVSTKKLSNFRVHTRTTRRSRWLANSSVYQRASHVRRDA